jgi:hypothetical protein
VATAVGIVVLRRRLGPSPGVRVPRGPLVPLLAVAGSLAFLFSVGRAEIVLSAWLIGGGLAVGILTRALRPV